MTDTKKLPAALLRPDLKKGGKIHGFEILEIIAMPELEALGIYAKHIKSGAEVFHIYNEDEENLFAYCFPTWNYDSTGVAHILEHTVLCGSKNYPLKDPFSVLKQGSLATFLNAWTFNEKTAYPASSVNEYDYFNLMSVYGDAVFAPLLSEQAFLQEGWRFEFRKGAKGASKSGKLAVTGVVYNEMKGAYSEPDEYAEQSLTKYLLPGTPYCFDFGGDPKEIPALSYKKFKDFYKKMYSPSNCRVFLAGNIKTEKQLEFLDNKFLSKHKNAKSAGGGAQGSPAPFSKFAASGKIAGGKVVVEAPASRDLKPTVFLGINLGIDVVKAPSKLLDFIALDEILLGHDGSPLVKALLESGLGEDLANVSGLSCEYRELLWSAGLRGVEPAESAESAGDGGTDGNDNGTGGNDNEEKIKNLIYEVLKGLVRDGIPQKEIENALLAIEFENREVKRSGGPWSLALLCRSLRGWIHGRKPWDTLLFEENLRKLKEKLKKEPRYFESLLEKYYINNKRNMLISVRPTQGFLEKEEAALQEKLRTIEKKLKPEEIKQIKENSKLIEKRLRARESKALLKTIPHLKVRDLKNKIELVPFELRAPGGVLTLSHKLWTRGICYFDIAFPFDVLEPEDYSFMPLFAHCITGLGVKGMDYAETSSQLARETGGFFAINSVFPLIKGKEKTVKTEFGEFDILGRDWLKFRMKCLDEKIGGALKLVTDIIKNADFSDERRLRDLILEIRNDVEASIAARGTLYALLRAASTCSLMSKKAEIMSGISLFASIRNIAALETREIASRLEGIRDKLLSKTGPIVSITTESEADALRAVENYISGFGIIKSRNPASEDPANFENIIYSGGACRGVAFNASTAGFADSASTAELAPEPSPGIEIFASEALQTGFAAMCIRGRDWNDKDSIMDAALGHYLSSGPLWDTLRGMGGAYGAHANSDAMQGFVQFTTFRDPKPLDSIETIPEILKRAAVKKIDREHNEKTIIGTYSGIKHPATNAQKGRLSLRRFLAGIKDEERAKRLSALLAARAEDLQEAALNLCNNYENSPPHKVIIAGKACAEESALKTGAPAREV